MKQNTSSEEFATKYDFQEAINNLAVRQSRKFTDIRNDIKANRKDSLRLEERVENVEDSTQNLQKDLRKNTEQLTENTELLKKTAQQLTKNTNILIELVGKIGDLQTDNTVGANQIHELHENSADHEKRIEKLEKLSN